jgi:RecG-like helicase
VANCIDFIKKYGQTTAKPFFLYHAKLTNNEKDKNICDFCDSEEGVLVGTIAISLGLNTDASCVIIQKAPNSLEELTQMMGRVGRKGEEGVCYINIPYQALTIQNSWLSQLSFAQ